MVLCSMVAARGCVVMAVEGIVRISRELDTAIIVSDRSQVMRSTSERNT
jgi:hypothetical protein